MFLFLVSMLLNITHTLCKEERLYDASTRVGFVSLLKPNSKLVQDRYIKIAQRNSRYRRRFWLKYGIATVPPIQNITICIVAYKTQKSVYIFIFIFI